MPAYQSDLAYIHDAGFGDFARSAAPGLLGLLRGSGIHDGLVVDLGCGSGIWARALSDAGYDVLGIDCSPEMLGIARRRAPQARFLESSFPDADLPRCRAVTSIGESLCYRSESFHGPDALITLFARIHEALEPGGLFIFDIAAPGRGGGPPRRHFKGRDWAIVVDYDEDFLSNVLSRTIMTFRKTGHTYRRGEEIHRLNLYNPAGIAASLGAIGFRVRRLRDYGGLAFPEGLAAFAARKHGSAQGEG